MKHVSRGSFQFKLRHVLIYWWVRLHGSSNSSFSVFRHLQQQEALFYSIERQEGVQLNMRKTSYVITLIAVIISALFVSFRRAIRAYIATNQQSTD